jgi:hypothetical protein
MAFQQNIADVICDRLANGESLRAICRDEGMPSEATVRAWALDDVCGFAAQYARARELGYDRLAEEILEIADTPKPGKSRVQKADGQVEEREADMIEHRRLQVDSRKWMLSKMLPKRYGDKLELNGDLTVRTLVEELASLNGAVSSTNGGSEVA